jgi:hypothetical protein
MQIESPKRKDFFDAQWPSIREITWTSLNHNSAVRNMIRPGEVYLLLKSVIRCHAQKHVAKLAR